MPEGLSEKMAAVARDAERAQLVDDNALRAARLVSDILTKLESADYQPTDARLDALGKLLVGLQAIAEPRGPHPAQLLGPVLPKLLEQALGGHDCPGDAGDAWKRGHPPEDPDLPSS